MISVIVPLLNEAQALPALLAHLAVLRDAGAQIVLVDGGSEDGSVALARAQGWAVQESPRGRATQMNAGATAATGDTLVFLHADTRLPSGALDMIEAALAGRSRWGRFDVFIQGRSPVLKLVAAMMNMRSRLTGIATGDQALFLSRELFDAVGGFPQQPLMEDIEMSRRLKAIARPVCLRARVSTSGRRWEQRGVWATIWLMWRLRWAYWRGASPAALAQAYR